MNDDELKALNKEVKRKKRIASDHASLLHDLVEDRLYQDYAQLPELAEKCMRACIEWAEAKARLEQVEA